MWQLLAAAASQGIGAVLDPRSFYPEGLYQRRKIQMAAAAFQVAQVGMALWSAVRGAFQRCLQTLQISMQGGFQAEDSSSLRRSKRALSLWAKISQARRIMSVRSLLFT